MSKKIGKILLTCLPAIILGACTIDTSSDPISSESISSVTSVDSSITSETSSSISSTEQITSTSEDNTQDSSLTSESSFESVESSEESTSTSDESSESSEESTSSESSSSEEVTKSINAYYTDTKGMIEGNFYQSVNNGEYEEVTKKGTSIDNVPYYTVTYGAKVKVKLVSVGHFAPTGIEVDGLLKPINNDGYVIFTATVDDPDDQSLFFLELVVKYKDTTPADKAYKIELTNSAHLTLEALNDSFDHVTSADQGDKVYISVTASSEDYGVKKIEVKHYTSDIGGATYITPYYDSSKELYYFTMPFCYKDTSCTVIVYEKNLTLFKGSSLVGDYAVIRTYGLGVSDSYIKNLASHTFTFDASGEFIYKDSSYIGYATSLADGKLSYSYGNSTYTAYAYDKFLVFGLTKSGGSFCELFNEGSKDIMIAIKKDQGVKDVDFDLSKNYAFKDTSDNSYGLFDIKVQSSQLPKFFVDTVTKKVTFDVTTNMYLGESISSDNAVYGIYDKDNKVVKEFSYINDGGKDDIIVMTSPLGKYTNGSDTIVYINEVTAAYNGTIYSAKYETGSLTLSNETKKYVFSLNLDAKTFTKTSEETISAQEANFRGLIFSGKGYDTWDEKEVSVNITFDNYQTAITGTINWDTTAQNKYFFKFSATFDFATKTLTMEIDPNGCGYNGTAYAWTYNGLSKTGGKCIAKAVLTGKTLKIMNDLGSNVYTTKNATLTCADFVAID